MYVIVSKEDGRYFYYFDSEGVCFHSSLSFAVLFKTLLFAKMMIKALDFICEGFSDSVYIQFVEV